MEDKIISFMKYSQKHHLVLRQIWCSDQQRQESDSEHAWHVALFVMLLAKEYPQLNVEKMLKMVIIHDLAEIETGDVWVLDKKGREGKKEREQEAWKKILQSVPEETAKEWKELIEEYESKQTPEAKLVNSCDKLQPLIMNLLSEGKSWKKFSTTFDEIYKVKISHVKHDAQLTNAFETMMKEAKERKLLE